VRNSFLHLLFLIVDVFVVVDFNSCHGNNARLHLLYIHVFFFWRYVFAKGVFENRVNSLLLCKPFSASSIKLDPVG
jgi:hypothetical protein